MSDSDVHLKDAHLNQTACGIASPEVEGFRITHMIVNTTCSSCIDRWIETKNDEWRERLRPFNHLLN